MVVSGLEPNVAWRVSMVMPARHVRGLCHLLETHVLGYAYGTPEHSYEERAELEPTVGGKTTVPGMSLRDALRLEVAACTRCV